MQTQPRAGRASAAAKVRKQRGGKRPPPPGAVQYLVRPGAHISEKDAAILGPAIQRIIASGATNAARALVEAAEADTPEGRRLRRYFEWNNRKAAAKYRISQARTYIGSIQIEVLIDRRTIVAPAFVPTYRTRGEYTDIGTAVKDEDIVESLLKDALRALRAYQVRFNTLRACAEVSGLFEVIDRVLAEHHVLLKSP